MEAIYMIPQLARGVSAFARVDRAVQIAFGRITGSLLGLVSAPIIARGVGPDGRGETAAVLAACYILPIVLGFGLPLEVRRRSATEDPKAVLRGARFVILTGLAPSILVAYILTHTVFGKLDASSQVAAFIAVASAPLAISWMCDQSVLIARGRYRGVAVLQLLQPAVLLGVVGAMALLGSISVAGVILAATGGTFVSFVQGLAYTRTTWTGPRTSPSALVKGSVRFAGSAVAEAAANRLDLILVLPLIGATASGLYSAAVTVASAPLTLGHAVGASYFNSTAGVTEELQRASARAGLRGGLAAGSLVCGALALATPVLLPIIFGPAFNDAVPVALVALCGAPFAIAAFVGSMCLAASGRGWSMTVTQFTGLIVGIALLLTLAGPLGAVGAAVASCGGYLVLFVMTAVLTGGRIAQFVPRRADLIDAFRRLL